jgi:hypothetical protein
MQECVYVYNLNLQVIDDTKLRREKRILSVLSNTSHKRYWHFIT